FEKKAVQAKEKALEQVVRVIARSADAVVAVSEPIADEVRGFEPAGEVRVIPNGCDFDDFAGLEYHSGERFRLTHTGSFFGKRNPRPFLEALASSGLDDVVARFAGDFRSADREWVDGLGLGDRLELLPYLPHRRALELQRDSEANLLLLPDAAGRGRVVPSGKIFEYLAAERPILAAVPPDGTAAVLLVFMGAFLLVYLIGFFNLETTQAFDQFGKGITKWLLHFGFLICGVVYLTGKSVRFYWRTLAWFLGGITFNAAYGVLQLLSAQSGHNLDSLFLQQLTRGASQINIYGAVNGTNVYRPNALTGDPNHIGIML